MDELVFEVLQESDGGFVPECLTENIFTQADKWDELRRNVREAVKAYYFDTQPHSIICLQLVKDVQLMSE